jgi:hypothetical protein
LEKSQFFVLFLGKKEGDMIVIGGGGSGGGRKEQEFGRLI